MKYYCVVNAMFYLVPITYRRRRKMLIKRTCYFLWLTVSKVLANHEAPTNLIVDNEYMVHQYHDILGKNDKVKMLTLSDDLMKDAYLKMRQLIAIREEHEPFTSYNIGIIIGKISEKFRYMIEMYKDLWHKNQKRTELVGPGIRVIRVIHYIVAMELVHFLEVEIDQFVHVLESAATEDMENNNHMASALRMGEEKEEEEDELFQEEIFKEAQEEAAKSVAREQYLAKRLGMGPNITTTRKRFIDHWPVEDTWSLEGTNIY